MSQDLITTSELRVMTVDQAQREHYAQMVAKFKAEGPKIIAGIKNEEGVNRAAAWRIELRDFIRQVNEGAFGMASAALHRRKKEIDAEIDLYVDPVDKLFKEAKAKMERWNLQEVERVRALQATATKKAMAKAEETQQIKVQSLFDLGKPKAAMVAAQRPLIVAPPTVAMPKIPNAIWKKKYIVQIDDLGALLAYIAKNPEYHKMIDQDALTTKLESIAVDLDGNMTKFKGIQCLQTVNSIVVGGPK